MLLPAVTSTVPAWLAAVLVGVTGLGAIANALSGAIGAFVQLRRLEALDAQRRGLEEQNHKELLDAINQRGESR